jgi:hypothetical protein
MRTTRGWIICISTAVATPMALAGLANARQETLYGPNRPRRTWLDSSWTVPVRTLHAGPQRRDQGGAR